ncbi:MAG: hypothetical protein BKP49_02090 [Treponema sp. CETP13]|nr:MAG: hypothetical protein BKP49_02090 [Treponema sp. CETP13]
MVLQKKTIIISSILTFLLLVSCSSRTTLTKAEIAYQKGHYRKVLELTPLPEIAEFKEWGLAHTLLGSNARIPKNNIAQLADEKQEINIKNKEIELVLRAMLLLDNSFFEQYLLAWYEYYPMSQYHVDFATHALTSNGTNLVVIPANISSLIDFRISCYKRNWEDAYSKLTTESKDITTIDYLKNKPLTLLVDILKAITYGSDQKEKNGDNLSKAASFFPANSTERFLCHLYSGKLYDKANSKNRTKALEEFEYAMKNTSKPNLYDYALWYYLTTTKKNSTRSALNTTLEFASSWNDSLYFDDFLDELGESMLATRAWDTYYSTYKFLMPYASDYSKSKYAYIAGRLLQENLADNSETNTPKAIKTAFKTAWEAPDGKLYYRLMAANKLKMSTTEIIQNLTEKDKDWTIEKDSKTQKNIKIFLAEHDYQNAYTTYIANKFHVSTELALELGDELANTTSKDLNWYPEALRTYVAAIYAADEPVTKEQFAKIYPQYYSTFVHEYSTKYNFPEYYMYALIRSESFFNAKVVSYANAVGLTQLMAGTAADMARKLKISEYDTTKPDDNILLGTHYIQELYTRLDDSYIQAFFSYNGGITRVRRWRKENPDLPLDLFLEVVPIAQTREYGRKIATAAAMYGTLYYGKSTNEVLNEIFEK